METPVGIHHNGQCWKCWKSSAGYGLTLELSTVNLAEHTLELLLDFQHSSVGFPRLRTSELTSVERPLGIPTDPMLKFQTRWGNISNA
jgi:hypothetical protein